MKVELFTHFDIDKLQKKVNEWLLENKDLKMVHTQMSVNTCNDFVLNTAPPMLCNQWQEYTMTIIYEDK